MKTLEQAIAHGQWSFDGRCRARLAAFMTANQVKEAGMEFTNPEAEAAHQPIEWTRDNILSQLKQDTDFAFEKALDKRGISAGCMFAVLQMWGWVLEEGLENWPDHEYAQYGLPLMKATAVKYGFPNPIGDDEGCEPQYASE